MFSYGSKFKITIYGSSHESVMGVIIDGIPAGTVIKKDLIMRDLELRKPGEVGTTQRVENDNFTILNGLFNDVTTGAPIHVQIKNENLISKDYENLKHHPRPGHADYVASIKYQGFNDYRGGGFFSGRLTTLIVIAGSIAKMLFPYEISSKLIQIGTLTDMTNLDQYLKTIKDQGDSVGGIIEVRATKVPVGLGDPYFNKIDASISHLIMTIPGVKGIIFGDSFDVSEVGSVNNDIIISKDGKTETNHAGGINGGITNGNDIVFKVLVKPTSSIAIEQKTFNFEKNKIEKLIINGRHDVAFVRRLPIVLESALAIVLANYSI